MIDEERTQPSVASLLDRATSRLARAEVPDPLHDAELLLEHTLDASRSELALARHLPIAKNDAVRYEALISRRERREPLQQIVGRWPFLELDLRIDSRALVPRPETEDVTRVAREMFPAHAPILVADVGTGSGCIALAIAHSHPRAEIVAIDRDSIALRLARENGESLPCGGRVSWVFADLLEPFSDDASFDLIVANLPYIESGEIARLEPEVRDGDPRLALDGGSDGLALIRRLIADLPKLLARGGSIVLESAPDQCAVIADALRAVDLVAVEIRGDRFGRERVTCGRRRA